MENSEVFKKNIDRWAVTFPKDAEKLEQLTCARLSFCTASNGMQNLKCEADGKITYLHSQQDPVDELFKWLSTLNLIGVQTVIFYGVGLGYAYEILHSWLKADPQRSLVFIEDDPEVLHRLFECERGTLLLQDSQVWIFLIENLREGSEKFQMLARRFGQGKYQLTGLCSYLEHKIQTMVQLNDIVEYLMNMQYIVNTEMTQFAGGFYNNFYYNVFDLPHDYLAGPLEGKFKGVPAIICGAGPSLKKNIELLATLKDKALIFGGGTAMNALNNAGIHPHFGVGIDPNSDQILRLITNTAYDIPYFYHRRLNAFALQAVHGDHLYVSSGLSYPLSDWLDRHLGLSPKNLDEGYNVVNFSLAIAHALGCNPIITVGVDLAYSEDASYSTLSDPHPIYANKQAYRTKGTDEELIPRVDIHGKPVLTLWKWLIESAWYANYLLEHPEMTMINATEGGLGFPGVPNMTLKDAVEKYMATSLDLDVAIHGEIQKAKVPENITNTQIENLLEEISSSLTRCEALCEEIKKEYQKQLSSTENPLLASLIEKLKAEVAYRDILRQFDDHCVNMFLKEMDKLELRAYEEDDTVKIRTAEIHIERYNLLKNGATINKKLLTTAKENYCAYIKKEIPPVQTKTSPKQEGFPHTTYSFEHNILTIVDPALNINLYDDSGTVSATIFYANGKKKIEKFLHNSTLHGPVRFFSETGSLLAEEWYNKGVRLGRSVSYFEDGTLCSIKYYRDHYLQGEYRVFYRNGNIKTRIDYAHGKYHGKVHLYYPNGQLKRIIDFKEGIIDGEEKVWNIDGKIIIDANYKNGRAVGLTRYWDPTTERLLKEVTFDEEGEITHVNAWDYEGTPLDLTQNSSKDYFDTMVNEANKLTSAIDQIYQQLEQLLPVLFTEINKNSKGKEEDFSSALEDIKQQIGGLRKIGKTLSIESGMDRNSTEEPIWKSPSMQAMMQERLNIAGPIIEQGILSIQTALCKTLIALEERNKQSNNE